MPIKLFERTSPDNKTIFIVEDNNVYARLLKTVIQTRFPEIKEVEIFSIGELCLAELDRNPAIVIMDYFLNTKYDEDDEKHNGLSMIKRIRSMKPNTNILLLSGQQNINVALEATVKYDCSYVQKDQEAFDKVEQFIRAVFSYHDAPAFEAQV